MEHAACGEDQEPVVRRRHSDRLMRPGVELQLPAVALLPVRIQVQDGSNAPVVQCLIAVVVQRKAAAIACMQHPRSCSRYCCPISSSLSLHHNTYMPGTNRVSGTGWHAAVVCHAYEWQEWDAAPLLSCTLMSCWCSGGLGEYKLSIVRSVLSLWKAAMTGAAS